MRQKKIVVLGFSLIIGLFAASVQAQNFGASKTKVTLQRKLPALAHLTGTTFKVRASGRDTQRDLAHNLEALLETELLKDDPHLRADESAPSTIINCQITDFAHPQPTVTTRASLALTKNAPKTQAYTRVTGNLTVAFQAKTAAGQTLSSDNVTAKYDEEFDSSGTNSSHGVKGTVTDTWKRITGGAGSEDLNPPTDAELQTKLLADVVHKIAERLVNTNEILEVYLAKGKGPIDEGDKQAESGLWSRALETFETAPPLPKPDEDAYRLYDIGVAYEALAYAAEDEKTAMKYLDESAINYGKAIDSKPAEKYFLEPQKRIETAIAHYKELEDQHHQREVAEEEEKRAKSAPVQAKDASAGGNHPRASSKGMTNAQVLAMVKSGMDDDTIVQAIRASRSADFDLGSSAQQDLGKAGVSAQVLTAMKARAARKAVATK
jgi:tetratricopeptide (TPR) repeat protein